MIVGLRVDVDTFRGTKRGVPRLRALLARHGAKATFFFSVGPDNMGRHLRRLLRPAFLGKMLRSRAASLYGWDILLRGTFWPGPVIGERLASVIRAIARGGHEIGLHAWDHHAWQVGIESMDRREIHDVMGRGIESLTAICGKAPVSFASPGWRSTEAAVEEAAQLGFTYSSDCRGDRIFLPECGGRVLGLPQVPVTLPTYDEIIGSGGVNLRNYNQHMLDLLRPDGLNVLTVHAEVEGIARAKLFDDFLAQATSKGIAFTSLSHLVPDGDLPPDRIERRTVPGREGWMAWQASCRL